MASAEAKAVLIEVCCTDAGPSELDSVTRQLRDEIESATDIKVSETSVKAPPRAKAGEATIIGQLLLTAIGSGGLAVALVSVLKDWLMRHQGFKLRLKHGQDELEVSGITAAEFQKLLARLKTWPIGQAPKQ